MLPLWACLSHVPKYSMLNLEEADAYCKTPIEAEPKLVPSLPPCPILPRSRLSNRQLTVKSKKMIVLDLNVPHASLKNEIKYSDEPVTCYNVPHVHQTAQAVPSHQIRVRYSRFRPRRGPTEISGRHGCHPQRAQS